MKSLVFFLFLSIGSVSFGQNKAVDAIFLKFDGKPGVTSISISKELMNLASQLDTGTLKVKEIFDHIDGIRVISMENASVTNKNSFKKMVSGLSLQDYKELMNIRESGNTVQMLTKDNQGKITEFLLLVSGDHDQVLVNINGNIDPKDLGKLSSCTQLNGFKYFAQLNHKK